MATITGKRQLNKTTVALDIASPLIAKKAQAGQFVILRIDEYGERIPLTINDTDGDTFRVVFQALGKTTTQLAALEPGVDILDVLGPLGRPSELEGERVALVLGGLGCAIGYFCAKQLFLQKKKVDIIVGFRSRDMLILTEELAALADNFYLCSDDGSVGQRGYVTDKLADLLTSEHYDLVVTIGPLAMMKATTALTGARAIKTIASLNPIMIDGSGMCGCCRVTYDGEIKFACVDGPDFLADKVDFDELIARNNFYRKQEQQAFDHYCNLLKGSSN